MVKKVLKIFMYLLLAAVLLIGIFIYFLSKSDNVGVLAKGERLKIMQSKPTYKNGAFENMEYTPALKEGESYFKVMQTFLFNKDKRNVPSRPLPTIKTDLKRIPIDQDVLVWFGHSSYFIQINGKKILVDPVFSDNASPIPGSVKAFKMTSTYTNDDLPEIDILIITHDHWDHLDYPTFLNIKNKVKTVITGLGVGSHLEKWGYPSEKIHELYWGESLTIDSLQFTACTARHFAGRLFKRNSSLWSSFVLKSATYNLFLGGDSGYGKHFKEIGEKHGPFDLAILENGQYNESWKYIHLMPEEVILAAQDLNAKTIIPVHSSKFPLANHAWDEPLIRVSKEAIKQNYPIWTPQIGQIAYLNQPNKFSEWWIDVD